MAFVFGADLAKLNHVFISDALSRRPLPGSRRQEARPFFLL